MRQQKAITIILTYVFAVLIAVLAQLILLVIGTPINKTTSLLLFFPAIIISAWYGGFAPGVVTTLIAAIEMDFFVLNPTEQFGLMGILPFVQILLFILEGLFISFFIDSGKRRDNVSTYRKREKEYAKQLLELEEKYNHALEEIRSRDEFLSVASHELKTPLTSMLLQLQTALHNIRSVSLAQFSVENLLKKLESAENQTKRLSRMINDLLNISLITTGRLELDTEEADLAEIVKDVLEDFEQKLEKEKYITQVTADNSVIGNWDKVRIAQAVSNLLSNAIKYGKSNPIEIAVTQQHHKASITIRDHGIGVPKQEQKRIFALFQRAVSSNDYKGLGVGLYITNQIAKAHGGELSLSSKEGKGSTFVIELPTGKSPEPKLFH